MFREKVSCRIYKNCWIIDSNELRVLSGSPDGIAAVSTEDSHLILAAIEVETMASINTIDDATKILKKFGAFASIETIGNYAQTNSSFQ